MLDDLYGHATSKKFLKIALAAPPASLLFTGPSGVGKRTFALHWISELFQDDSVVVGHSDVHLVVPEKNSLKIDQIRTLLADLHDRPCEADYKVYVIDGVDTMTKAAANMLLKPLEEPPPSTLFVLITSNVDGVIPTIRSRCHELEFQSATKADLLRFVKKRIDDDDERAQLISKLADGSYELATKLIAGGMMHYREQAASFAGKLGRETPAFIMDYLKGVDDIFEFFQIFKSIVCDLVFLRSGLPQKVVNLDLLEQLQVTAAQPYVPGLYDAVRLLSGRMKLIRSNFVFHFQTEMMLLRTKR